MLVVSLMNDGVNALLCCVACFLSMVVYFESNESHQSIFIIFF